MTPTVRAHAFASSILLAATAAFAESPVDHWNKIAINASVTVAKRTQTVSTMEVAIVQGAVYDAVNAIDGNRYQPYAAHLDPVPWAYVDAAVATAAHDVLVWLYPAQQADLDMQLSTSLAPLTPGSARDAGITLGAAAAAAMIALRTGDGRDADVTYLSGSGPGAWIPTPPLFLSAQTPWVAKMQKMFTMTSVSQFRPGPPPPLTSHDYTESFEEVRTRGAASDSTRSAAETVQARFWSDNFTAQWNRYARGLATAQHLDDADRARLLAEMNMAGADAATGCLEAKYFYGFWRPVTAIPAAATDGNGATDADPTWMPLLITPNHPEYPSAHACGSKAITDLFIAFFGTDSVSSAIDSTVTGTTREFPRFSDLYRDVHEARILGGLHYRFSMNAGRTLGTKVTRQLVQNYFRPQE
jgi:hypothetical protein